MKKTNKLGEKHITNEGYTIEIIEYFIYSNCTIRFDNGLVLKNKGYGQIEKGQIKNPYHNSVFNIGCIGLGKYSNKTHPKTYQTWKGMLERCYDSKHKEKQPTYKGCSVVQKWCNFQIFAEWFDNNYKEGFALDKDILIKGNKIYSPETCCFIPQEVNSLFTKSEAKRGEYPIGVVYRKKVNKYVARLNKSEGRKYIGAFNTPEEAFQAYKTEKEIYIKEVADKYKNLIHHRAYEAMYNYEVEITD